MLIKNAYLPGQGARDIRIERGTITAIESTLDGPADLDATNLVAIPGFVDTHRHMVQSPLRGLAPDMPLAAYFTEIISRMDRYTEEDIHNAILLGAAEAIDAGVTTVLDWAGTPAALTIETYSQAGIRAVFANSNTENDQDIRKYAGLTGRVTTALAPLGPDFMSLEDTKQRLKLARELGLMSSMHIGGTKPGGVAALHEAGLLGPDLHFVHGNRLTDDELRMIADTGSSLTVSTVVESLMGHGETAYNRFRAAGGTPALGVDVVINNRPDLFTEMQSTLWRERLKTPFPAKDLLKSATQDGAKAIGLPTTGHLTPGNHADIVLLNGLEHLLNTPADLAGAIVTSLGTENVQTVLVDGEIQKLNGNLVNHSLTELRTKTRAIAAKLLT
ncbi:amidohydrolase family protein [Actinocrispum wychmicini]|uniref:Cytosine/adenosine deaminase-related metal-dependent hydrolase n=1 Tax=Actinocrispum wychmicini TaxID=1213861 RepID=A0A4R2JS76_9PSEU|nr:amidohydrolase family protein [Actinocrispum wychmicini]TCO62434.1 cytosine/adenosine deaminase-related metal-dependent hydrolase [Actinocrispum wychmicini]